MKYIEGGGEAQEVSENFQKNLHSQEGIDKGEGEN